MKKITKLNILLTSLFILFGVSSCNGSNSNDNNDSNIIYADDFVNALVKKYDLKANNGKYIYTTTLEDHTYEYSFTLTCISDSTFSYIFDATLTKEIEQDDITGTISSKIKFLWSRFTSASFNGIANLKNETASDYVHLNYYGILFNNDGTIKNSCYTYTIDGVADQFTSIDIINTSWSMTRLQVSTLSSMCLELVNCYLW